MRVRTPSYVRTYRTFQQKKLGWLDIYTPRHIITTMHYVLVNARSCKCSMDIIGQAEVREARGEAEWYMMLRELPRYP